ncbi:unnamed protein product [Acanthosepion pharaonis]|uniref:Uncharacterized protein n=1 Tax=Acanthosepion pharaonis TaxID=158019 RepID=A0A812B356_ACAPH|nr:unnamed protein product [Sepia pharaonis]
MWFREEPTSPNVNVLTEELTSLKFYVVPEEPTYTKSQCGYRGTNLTEVLCGPRNQPTVTDEIQLPLTEFYVVPEKQPTRKSMVTEELTSLKFYVVPEEPTHTKVNVIYRGTNLTEVLCGLLQCGYRGGTNLTEVLCGPRGTNPRMSMWLQRN